MPIINKSTQFFGIVIAAALIPLLLTVATALALLITGSATQAEIALPLLAMAILSAAIFLIMGIPTVLLSLQERNAILRLINTDHWVKWPQYRSEEDWRAAAEKMHQREMEANAVSWIPIIIVTILMAFGLGVPALVGALKSVNPIVLALPIVTFYLILLALVVGRPMLKQGQSKSVYKQRSTSPIPNVYIGKQGLYHEIEGYHPFGGMNNKLANVNYKDSSPASLTFRINRRFGSSTVRGALRDTDVVSVRVLADYREEAQSIAQRLVSEGLVRK